MYLWEYISENQNRFCCYLQSFMLKNCIRVLANLEAFNFCPPKHVKLQSVGYSWQCLGVVSCTFLEQTKNKKSCDSAHYFSQITEFFGIIKIEVDSGIRLKKMLGYLFLHNSFLQTFWHSSDARSKAICSITYFTSINANTYKSFKLHLLLFIWKLVFRCC